MAAAAYERAQEALLVGRYLKENNLVKTLNCFVKETPVKTVPQVGKNMPSLTQILREYQTLCKERELYKEQKKRMHQYEEILNLLFDELRDVYNFHSSSNDDFPAQASHHHETDGHGQQEDNILVEDYGINNPGDTVLAITPVATKHGKMRSSPSTDTGETMLSSSSKSSRKDSPNKIKAFLQQCENSEHQRSSSRYIPEHHHQLRRHRRLHGRSKHHLPSKPPSPVTFVAYSSLPMGSSQSCYTDTNEMKGRGANMPDERHEGCATVQNRDMKDTSTATDSCCESPLFSTSSDNMSKHSKISGTEGNIGTKSSMDASPRQVHNSKHSPTSSSRSPDGQSTTRSMASSSRERGPSQIKFDQNLGNTDNPQCSSSSPYRVDTSPREQSPVATSPPAGTAVDADRRTKDSTALALREEYVRKLKEHDHQHHRPHYCYEKQQARRPQMPHYLDIASTHHDVYGVSNIDAVLLATETANLLERLLPLVADPETMKSFISNLDTLSPHPTPRDHHRKRQHEEPVSVCSKRPPISNDRPCGDGGGATVSCSELDDEEVLAELEEVVGKTVDDILDRYST